MMGRILCFIGIHRWHTYWPTQTRTCDRCHVRQFYTLTDTGMTKRWLP